MGTADNEAEDARAKAWTLRNSPIRISLDELVPLDEIRPALEGTEQSGDTPYSVKLTAAAKRQLDGLGEQQATQLTDALRTLACVNPRGHDSVREISRQPTVYRLIASGDARAILTIDEEEDRVVEVLKVGLLADVYD